MSLVRFLRGATPRPNPASAWVLGHRHAEGGPWAEVDRLGSREGVADWVLSPAVVLDHGDLVRLSSPEGKVVGFWVQTLSGLASAGRVPPRLGDHRWDWEAAWEGPEAEGDDLLRESEAVDRWRLVLAAADCAETALPYVPENETRPKEAIEVARRWVRGEASPEEVAQAKAAAFDASRSAPNRSAPSDAAFAATESVRVISEKRNPGDAAASVAYSASRAASYATGNDADARLAARHALAPLVRRWIPLSLVLLARAGEPTSPGV